MDGPENILRSVFGFESFRPGQAEIVEAILAGRDVLAIMPTGGGKSLCYQLPALARDGLTLVISPLIALMRDQVTALREAGVEAGALTSANDPYETERVFSALDDGRLRLLYMAPERLGAPATAALLNRAGVGLLAVDEAHCVSQWGHDFRPDYLRIGELRRALGGVQTAAFTATADEETRGEIAGRLFDTAPEVFLRGFDRPNLTLAFEPKDRPQARILAFATARRGQSGIIYCASRKKTEAMASALAGAGLDALPYHAGLDPETRAANQDRFVRGEGVVMAATVAFGMGVDKPDVRYVVHADLPKSVEAYYQEIGRAGRDGLPADTLTLYGIEDIKLRRLQIADSDMPAARKEGEHARLAALLALAETPDCRRRRLLAFFGEELGADCGNCDRCLKPPETEDGTETVRKALAAMWRTGERFGTEHLISVLRGEASDRVRQLGHDKVRTFGTGREIDQKRWRQIYRQLLGLGLATVDGNGGWQMTEDGRSVLKGERPVRLVREPLPQRQPRGAGTGEGGGAPRPAPPGLSPADEELFQALRARRMELARTKGLPPYMVFSDATLIDMAHRKPRSLDEFAEVHGVGAKKLETYGRAFLEIVMGAPAEKTHPARVKLASGTGGALLDRLTEIHGRLTRGEDGTERFLSLPTATLARIAEARPASPGALEAIPGMSEQKTDRFGSAFLAAIAEAE